VAALQPRSPLAAAARPAAQPLTEAAHSSPPAARMPCWHRRGAAAQVQPHGLAPVAEEVLAQRQSGPAVARAAEPLQPWSPAVRARPASWPGVAIPAAARTPYWSRHAALAQVRARGLVLAAEVARPRRSERSAPLPEAASRQAGRRPGLDQRAKALAAEAVQPQRRSAPEAAQVAAARSMRPGSTASRGPLLETVPAVASPAAARKPCWHPRAAAAAGLVEASSSQPAWAPPAAWPGRPRAGQRPAGSIPAAAGRPCWDRQHEVPVVRLAAVAAQPRWRLPFPAASPAVAVVPL
jgi:hypothetical protein